MIEIEIKKQKQLTLRETFDFCLSSIRHRFVRSLLTLAVVVLAVAFFMYLQCSNIYRNSVKSGVKNEITASRMPSRLLGMLYTPFTINEFSRMLVDSRENQYEIDRFAKVLKTSPEEIKALLETAFDDLYYQNFFMNDLSIGRRKELFDRLEGREVFVFLCQGDNLDKSLAKLLSFGGIRIPGGNEKFAAFIHDYPEYQKKLESAFHSWQSFQKQIKDKFIAQNDASQIRLFILKASADPALKEKWMKNLADNGFILTEAEWKAIEHYQILSDRIGKVQTVLSDPDYRKKWRRAYGQTKYIKMDDKMTIIDSPKAMKVLEGAVYPGNAQITKSGIKEIADEFRLRKNLRHLEIYLDINMFENHSGFSTDQLYLMALSFLVCVVGITNAMLMSITERFREIATLKCLGATDSFILVQIVLEAMIQGVIGSVIGIIIGFIAASINSLLQVGLRIFSTFDIKMILIAAGSSLIAGMLLSVLAALYPSYRAARMAPMEAMRIE